MNTRITVGRMQDWLYLPKRDLYKNRWQNIMLKGSEVSGALQLMGVDTPDEVNKTLNQIAQRKLEHGRKIRQGKQRVREYGF